VPALICSQKGKLMPTKSQWRTVAYCSITMEARMIMIRVSCGRALFTFMAGNIRLQRTSLTTLILCLVESGLIWDEKTSLLLVIIQLGLYGLVWLCSHKKRSV